MASSNGIKTDWPSEQDIARHHRAAAPQPRTWSRFDLTKCTHPHLDVAFVGVWALNVCTSCGTTVSKVCEHKAEWNELGTLLRCKHCGHDCT